MDSDDESRDPFHTSDDEDNDPDYVPEASTSATWSGINNILKDTGGVDKNENFQEVTSETSDDNKEINDDTNVREERKK